MKDFSSAPSRPYFFCLDSSDGSGVSYVGFEPAEIIENDFDLLHDALEKRSNREQFGGAVGFWNYDGSFRAGIFEKIYVLERGQTADFLRESEPSILAVGAPRSNEDRQSYIGKIKKAQRYIAEGHVYQVNLSHRFSAPYEGDALGLYRQLRRVSPAPYSAFLRFGDTTICSASPELFFRVRGRSIETRPIKGTMDRAQDAEALLRSQKDRAELLMIVDLERNDLAKICEYGSVGVKQLFGVESFAQVHHLVATVQGSLRRDVRVGDIFRAMFPGGSVTGAPKIRAMEIIAELESVPRSVYTGAIGIIGFNGDCDFNIAIRTVYANDKNLFFHAGGGIVADSEPEKEWDETLLKAKGIFEALDRFAPKHDIMAKL